MSNYSLLKEQRSNTSLLYQIRLFYLLLRFFKTFMFKLRI